MAKTLTLACTTTAPATHTEQLCLQYHDDGSFIGIFQNSDAFQDDQMTTGDMVVYYQRGGSDHSPVGSSACTDLKRLVNGKLVIGTCS